jgi:hypothetical protein
LQRLADLLVGGRVTGVQRHQAQRRRILGQQEDRARIPDHLAQDTSDAVEQPFVVRGRFRKRVCGFRGHAQPIMKSLDLLHGRF